jgi:hypothetical protein
MSVKTDEERAVTAKTPEQAKILEKNALARGNQHLAKLARLRGIELSAAKLGMGGDTDVEREGREALSAYESLLSEEHGKKTVAGYTRRIIRERGIVQAIEHLVTKRDETLGYTKLVEVGLQWHAFEAVVLRHPESFSIEAVDSSRERLGPDWHE